MSTMLKINLLKQDLAIIEGALKILIQNEIMPQRHKQVLDEYGKIERFLLAAFNYARLMKTDFRNALNVKEVTENIDQARHEFYDSYETLVKEKI